MTDFPTLVYRTPGPHRLSGSGTYDYCPAKTKAELDELLADGWRASLFGEPEPEAEEGSDDRKALEVDARALGVSFNWKTSDEVLASRIAEKKGES